MTEPRVSYLVCATQRSGSTLLCELLKDTGVAGRPEEYFEAEHDTGVPPHPGRFLERLPRTGVGIRDDETPPAAPAYSSLAGLVDYRAHLQRTFARGTTENGVFGAKLMLNQLPELQALTVPLPELAGLDPGALLRRLFGDAVYVWVSRRDTVRQAVSLWKALQDRRWRGQAGAGQQPVLHYSYAGIDHLRRWFDGGEAGWREHFARYGIEPLRVSYEDDLICDPEATVRRVLSRIGGAPPADWRVRPATARQADELSEQWVREYHRDRRASGTGAPAPGRP